MDEHTKKNEEAYNCGLTSVTDNLFVPSALPHIQVIKLNTKRSEIYTKTA